MIVHMTEERVQARVFGEVADEYDRIRPSYPDDLIDDVLTYSALDGAPALEVGAGTGKATEAFVQRGVTVTAIEPDPAMAALLARRLSVHIVPSLFEDWTTGERFGLLYSAQAWHWTDPATRWQRAADLLAPTGAIALFWNRSRHADPDLAAREAAVHQRIAPQVPREHGPIPDNLDREWPATDLAALPTFTDYTFRRYLWTRTLSTADYLAVLATHSSYRMLPTPTRDHLFTELAETLTPQVPLTMFTLLYLARRHP
jgi:SAM-dependent methyltransferase